MPSGLTANDWAVIAVVCVLAVAVVAVADDGCATVVLAASVWVVLLIDVLASFLDFFPVVGDSSASSSESDVLPSVDFASSSVDDVAEGVVLAVVCAVVPALASSLRCGGRRSS